MNQQTRADAVWNRACMGAEDARAPGDQALEAMITFHSVAMNGGALHAVECLSSEQLEAAEQAYRYFGIDDIAALIRAAQSALCLGGDVDRLEETLDRQYNAAIPDDMALVHAFESHYRLNPGCYATL